MSNNLIFTTRNGKYIIDFPHQTSTEITNLVLSTDSKEKQIKILKEDVEKCFENPEIIEDLAKEIYEMMK